MVPCSYHSSYSIIYLEYTSKGYWSLFIGLCSRTVGNTWPKTKATASSNPRNREALVLPDVFACTIGGFFKIGAPFSGCPYKKSSTIRGLYIGLCKNRVYRGPQNQPLHTIILIKPTPKKGPSFVEAPFRPLIFGNYH